MNIVNKLLLEKKRTKGTIVYTDGEDLTIYLPKHLLPDPFPRAVKMVVTDATEEIGDNS